MGLPLDRVDQGDLVQLFLEGVRAGKGGWIVTPNLDVLRQFRADAGSRELVLAASHRVADGQPIVWASRLAGTPVPERVPGSDLVLSLPEAAARAGVRVFLLGGNPGVAADAARRLQALNPGLQHVGSYCPPFGYEDDPGELDRIKDALRTARPTLVLIGLGFPKQERLIQALRPEFPEAWFAGVGISLSFLTGDQSRAPTMLQRLGLEWIAPPPARASSPLQAIRGVGAPLQPQAVRLGAGTSALGTLRSAVGRTAIWRPTRASSWSSPEPRGTESGNRSVTSRCTWRSASRCSGSTRRSRT